MSSVSKKIAVFYTGSLRTFESTLDPFINHLLGPNQPNIHVFACLQNDKAEPNAMIASYLEERLGKDVFKSIEWTDLKDPFYQEWLIQRIENLPIQDYWKDYLKTSGTVLEYTQFYKCFQAMSQQSLFQGWNYDYVVRLRTDVVVAHPIDFRTIPVDDFDGLIEWLYPERLKQGNFVEGPVRMRPKGTESNDPLVEASVDYKKWILSIRRNVFYILPGSCAHVIADIGRYFGDVRPRNDQEREQFPVWFDAESQLQLSCLQKGITVYNSATEMEVNSLYKYSRANYYDYDEHNEYLKINPQYMVFIRRHG